MEQVVSFILISILLLILLFKLLRPNRTNPLLPPGPHPVPFVLNTLLLKRASLFQLEQIIHDLHSIHGPIISLPIPFRPPTVCIADRDVAHAALMNPSLSDRASLVLGPRNIVTAHPDISTSSYGPLWRLLRRNLASETLQPSRLVLFSPARSLSLRILLTNLRHRSSRGIMECFQLAMFSLLVLMCFGEKIPEDTIDEIRELQYFFLRLFVQFNPFAVLPSITKHLFPKRWAEIVAAVRRQEEIFVPLIKSRRERKLGRRDDGFGYSYVDSLLDVELEGGRKLREEEIVSLCHEFMSGGTDTTSTALEWIIAELVKNQEVQDKLHKEINTVIDANADEIKEEDLQKLPYLKAVITEGLRRHPPGHFVLPHRATENITLNGFLVPKGAEVHINVAELGWDGRVWEEPMEFKPERFLAEDGSFRGVDLTGTRGIKMMPFGVGRRMCPGFGLAMLHLEYFVANLVREFEWKAVEGEEVDLSERLEFTTVMKYPLRAQIVDRR